MIDSSPWAWTSTTSGPWGARRVTLHRSLTVGTPVPQGSKE